MKQLITVTLLIISLTTIAQNTAIPSNIKSKDLYVFIKNNTPSNFVKTVKLTKQQITSINSLDNRIQTIIDNASNIDFDAIITRDGNTAQLVKYKTSKEKATTHNYFGKEVYFLSNPTKKYTVLETKEIASADLKKTFYHIGKNYSVNENITFDAVIISGNKAEYIQYK